MKRAALPTESVTASTAVVDADLEQVDGGFSFGLNFGLSLRIGRAPRPAVVAPAVVAPQPVVYQPAPVVYAPAVVAAPVYGVAYC
jgi:hypothetical protein